MSFKKKKMKLISLSSKDGEDYLEEAIFHNYAKMNIQYLFYPFIIEHPLKNYFNSLSQCLLLCIYGSEIGLLLCIIYCMYLRYEYQSKPS